jgi:hypothetical protein
MLWVLVVLAVVAVWGLAGLIPDSQDLPSVVFGIVITAVATGWLNPISTARFEEVGTRAGRQAARERVSAYHPAQLAGLITSVAAAIDRYRAGEIDACTADETIHHYHRAAGELWKFCFSGGGGSHDEFIAGNLDQMAADAENVDWWEPRHAAAAPMSPLIAASARAACQ